MPGFSYAIEGALNVVSGPMKFYLRDGKYNEGKAKNMISKNLKDEMKNKINDCIHGFEF
jgi:D-alanine-D-alanine ligase-like ATP-grasp enzyme